MYLLSTHREGDPCATTNLSPSSYSTGQMQGISLMRLLLATNAFITDNERIYFWRQTRLVIEKYTFSYVYEQV